MSTRALKITSRRGGALALTAAAALAAALLTAAPPAHADGTTTVNVVGTSDVYDSNLVQSQIAPQFHAADPQYKMTYNPQGTGAAIGIAQNGGADALIVHAPSLENSFVSEGYSQSFAGSDYGRAIFWGDYVLLGPASDPAGVTSNGDSHNIAGAFEDIAKAGAMGTADFVSRANTSGTAVQEHQIWAQTDSSVMKCTFTGSTSGGGEAPSTTGGDCASPPNYPSWYHPTGLTQGPNITNADTCDYGHGHDCYVFTDRGTYEYLKSLGEISNLRILVQDNIASGAPGGVSDLVNTFHAYAVNASKVGASLNTAGAEALINFIQSPVEQKRIGNYLSTQPGGPVFIPDASPKITVYRSATNVTSGTTVHIHGTVTNVVPDTPSLIADQVTLTSHPSSSSVAPVTRNTVTDSSGRYDFSFKPSANSTYTVSTPKIVQTEYPDLSPQFADVLAPASTTTKSIDVTGRLAVSKDSLSGRVLSVSGGLAPQVAGKAAGLTLQYAPTGTSGQVKSLGTKAAAVGSKTFSDHWTFPSAGSFKWKLQYSNGGIILPGTTVYHYVTVH